MTLSSDRALPAPFDALPARCLLLTPDLVIVAVTDAYLRAAMRTREDTVGRRFLEVLPDSFGDVSVSGRRAVLASIEATMKDLAPHTLPVQRFDIVNPASGEPEIHYWSTVTAPVVVDGALVSLVFHVDDATEWVRLKGEREANDRISESLAVAEREALSRSVRAEAATLRERALDDSLRAARLELALRQRDFAAQTEELRGQQRELLRKNSEVERADRAKSAFLANMSHELRTPLNSVIGFTDLLLDDPTLNDGHRQYLRDVRLSGKHLLGLINDILDLAKIEAGRAALDGAPIRPGDVVGDACDVVRAEAFQKQIRLTSELATARLVYADAGKLRQILVNLLSNALKFSPPGSEVHVRAVDTGRDVTFSVSDTGPGISDALRPSLFEPFVQGESPLVKKHQGTGLGLTITKRLVEMHGGRVDFVNLPTGGARFFFTIPASQSTAGSTGPVAMLVTGAGDGALAARLGGAGYRVEITRALHLEDALATHDPAVLIVDSASDPTCGVEIVDSLLRLPGRSSFPVVVTAAPRGGFVAKPFSAMTLLARMRRAAPASVLCIDDDADTRASLTATLSEAGYHVTTATGATDGLTLATKLRPDVVIIDVALPGLLGFDLLDALERDGGSEERQVIFLTAEQPSPADCARLSAKSNALCARPELSQVELRAAIEHAMSEAPGGPVAAGRILVVDDHDQNRSLARALLERLGHSVLEASDGPSAITIARAEHPDLVLMDLSMPLMDGFETTRHLKAAADTAGIPVVALTALAMRGDEERARAAGVEGYLTKPFDRAALRRTLTQVFRAHPPRRN